ncbi:MAG TPA: hypothetical protein DDZ91_02135 [Firmicutes bacterium]|jgi:hypothetical protein|nr:hypothetical protein [Bacillota bacterium]
MNLFLLALTAHLTGDFLLQSPQTVSAKNAGQLWGFIRHALLIMVLTLLSTHFYGLKQALAYALLVGLTHLVVDGGKALWEDGKAGGAKLLLFLGDQIIHLFLLVFFSRFFQSGEADPRVTGFYQKLFSWPVVPALSGPNRLPVINFEKVLWVSVTYLSAVFGGAVLTTKILCWLTDNPPEERTQRLSSAIGVMERLILITLVIADAVSAMGFVLAAKSLARYKELNDRDFAEYYLVGTLTSFCLALFAGLWLKMIL